MEQMVLFLTSFANVKILIVLCVDKGYTFNVKDTLLPRDPNTGREQSTISYEFDFKLSPASETLAKKKSTFWIPWSSFHATYRGREKNDAPSLKIGDIKRFGIMCRSFFGEQEGDFKLEIERIRAVKLEDAQQHAPTEKSNILVDDQVDNPERSVETNTIDLENARHGE